MPKILIVEDDTIIAIDLQDQLEQHGFRRINHVGTVEAAMTWLDRNHPDLAILDMRLANGTSESVAKRLAGDDVPMVVCSGDYQSEMFPCCADAPWVSKPCNSSDLVNAVLKALSPNASAPA